MEAPVRIAALWSVNPTAEYSPENEYVGSVLAHKAHIERHGAVYWDLTSVVGVNVEQFAFPMSGYLYMTDTKTVRYRVRILEMSYGYDERKIDYLPFWRDYEVDEKYLFMLIDSFDTLFPERKLSDFKKYTDGSKLSRPPVSGFTRISDPMY